jgi:hypothetical protein
MIAATVERGQQNLAILEQSIIKSNTLLPGEWYGGKLVFEPPDGDQKSYRLLIPVGPDVHEIDIAQGKVAS